MYRLTNTQLHVEILDPQADQDKFGVRYCTGGYIYQVIDTHHGPLLTGPTYPDSFNWFDGQGIPDAFNWSPLRAPTGNDADVLVLGIGQCDLLQQQVKQFCEWDIAAHAQQLRFSTHHHHAGFAVHLTRTISLQERTVRSHTELLNQGERFIPITWFPHPFFPQPQRSAELCQLTIPHQLSAESKGYELAPSGFIQRKAWPAQKGFYLALDHQAQQPLTVLQKHDQLGLIAASCSYVPSFFPIWGNQNTFSWEPFFQQIAAPEQRLSWWIDYQF